MTILNTVYASAPSGKVIIPTLEILVPGVEPIRVCATFNDVTATLESNQEVTFQASNIQVALPEKTNTGKQNLRFSIPNVTERGQEAINAALESDQETVVIYREFISDDLSAPANQPIVMTMVGGQFAGLVLQIEASYYDILNTAWPRERYTQLNAPAIAFL